MAQTLFSSRRKRCLARWLPASISRAARPSDARDVDAMLRDAVRTHRLALELRVPAACRIEQPVRAARLVRVEILAIVAANALRHDDLAVADRAPFARVLADLALRALGPALDPENRKQRQQPERGADGAQESTVEIANEHTREKQRGEPDPERRRCLKREHPERLDVAIERDLASRQEDRDRRCEDRVLDVARPPLDLR